MTSEPRPAPFRVPDRLFAELAAGGGSTEAIAFLERGERARRLLLLRTLLDRLAELPTPLTPVAEAWDTFKAAAERAPEAADRLLLAPTTGGWIAHTLRRVHGTATGPPLWAEAGRLNVLALTAALHAGTETSLTVPLTDGALPLPGLGLLRLPATPPGPTVARAVARAGELTLSGPPAPDGSRTSVTCRPTTSPANGSEPDEPRPPGPGLPGPSPAGPAPAARPAGPAPAPRAAGPASAPRPAEAPPAPAVGSDPGADPDPAAAAWLPLRTLTHTTPTGPVAIPLDDLDPYRDLDDPVPPARLAAGEAAQWQRLFDDAVAILAGAGTGQGPGRLDPAVVRAVVPYGRTALTPPAPPTVEVSASSGDSYGAMVISRPGSALALAETLVHEFQHSKLAALLHLFPLLDDDREERFYAPWRADPRHLTGLLHGAYAFTGVAGFWRDRLTEPAHAETAAYHFALRRLQSRLVVRTLLTSARLTAPGHRLVAGLARTLDGWLRVPVDPAVRARARTAAALHRTQWRLRNVAAPDTPADDAAPTGPADGALRFRPDRGFWPDTRTRAFALRPADPRTPDEHLAAGDPATALDGYAKDLARDPADPHALSGWIVARAVLDPGHSTRRPLARPELLRPRPGG
ncbi:aKG-HExxH-type peptide beta-hydroxylase [Streptomyces sp. DH41]|uniref:aKG-HExxH-type peptide beta-hydroxylase n=1 Tax=Streptomyces sp. DH41 TaxID=3040125 RepID=UPI002440ED2C|nr:HEXXH motif-containing putative peptide modification protein [Streptomyces sp. DH41]MDG9726967.1 HEXXH motif-containing putative peptide modification protein [Streptomyces sp. DH41]